MHGIALVIVFLGAGNDAAIERARLERARAEGEVREIVTALDAKRASLEVDLVLARIESEALAATARAWREAADKTQGEREEAVAAVSLPLAGLELKDIDPQVAKVLGIAPGQGAWVTNVASGSPAQAVGLTATDILVALDGQTIAGPTWFQGAIKRAHGDLRLKVAASPPTR